MNDDAISCSCGLVDVPRTHGRWASPRFGVPTVPDAKGGSRRGAAWEMPSGPWLAETASAERSSGLFPLQPSDHGRRDSLGRTPRRGTGSGATTLLRGTVPPTMADRVAAGPVTGWHPSCNHLIGRDAGVARRPSSHPLPLRRAPGPLPPGVRRVRQPLPWLPAGDVSALGLGRALSLVDRHLGEGGGRGAEGEGQPHPSCPEQPHRRHRQRPGDGAVACPESG